MDAWMTDWTTNKWMNEWHMKVKEWMVGWINKYMNERMNDWKRNEWIDEWKNEWMSDWLGGWLHSFKWMNEHEKTGRRMNWFKNSNYNRHCTTAHTLTVISIPENCKKIRTGIISVKIGSIDYHLNEHHLTLPNILPDFPRISSRLSAFFFWGIKLLPVLWAATKIILVNHVSTCNVLATNINPQIFWTKLFTTHHQKLLLFTA